MSGFKGKFHRQHLCSRFTKDLVRRSRSRCECCSRSGSRLEILEIEPLLEEPAPDHALFLCESCIKQIQRPEKNEPPRLALSARNHMVRASCTAGSICPPAPQTCRSQRNVGRRTTRTVRSRFDDRGMEQSGHLINQPKKTSPNAFNARLRSSSFTANIILISDAP